MRKNTLLSKLGFQDKDKLNPMHDALVQYISLPQNLRKLLSVIKLSTPPKSACDKCKTIKLFEHDKIDTYCCVKPAYQSREDNKIYSYKPSNGYNTIYYYISDVKVKHKVRMHAEVPLSKGDGQYKCTIGFIDGILNIDYVYEIERTFLTDAKKKDTVKKDTVEHTDYVSMLIESKVFETPIGDILRQIKLYREYMVYKPNLTLLLTPESFKITPSNKKLLSDNGIKWISVGSKFNEWYEKEITEKGDAELIL